jgi:cell wall-associated NlpC family hydrolase
MAAAGLAGVIAGVALTPASADPIAAKQAQATAIANQIDLLGRREAALSEQYDKAVLATQATAAQVQQATQAVASAQSSASQARNFLQANAIDAYVNGGSLAVVAARAGGPVAAADGGVLRDEYVKSLAGTQSDALDSYRSAAVQEQEAQARLQSAEKAAQKAQAGVDSAKVATISAHNQLVATLAQVKGQLATLVAQAQAAAQAAAARQAAATLLREQQAAASAAAAARALATVVAISPGSGGGGGGSLGSGITNPAPPVGRGAATAVAAAETRLGDPYVWGAAGPSAFDCSGLVMWAWAHAGVNLPHFSGAQYASTQHISMSQLQPGDLVFPANPGEHVAMYVGGGQIIEAPHTGAVVHIVPLSSWFVLASRP